MKNYYYIGVQTEHGMAFVTSVDWGNKQFVWDITTKPLKFSTMGLPDRIAEEMLMNLIPAAVVKSPVEINSHWVSTDLIIETLCEEEKFKALGLGKDDFYIDYNDIDCIYVCQPKNDEDKLVGRYSFIAHDFIKESEEK